MVNEPKISVIHEESGPQTGDRVYIDEYGCRWDKIDWPPISLGTGDRIGILRDNKIYEKEVN